jgi:hypothetical protein
MVFCPSNIRESKAMKKKKKKKKDDTVGHKTCYRGGGTANLLL